MVADARKEVPDLNQTSLTQLAQQVSDYVASLRTEYRAGLVHTIGSGEAALYANGMTSIAAAIRAYVLFGMPGALGSDEYLSALLQGDHAILVEGEDRQMSNWIQYSAQGDPWVSLAKAIDERAADLETSLSNDLRVVREKGDGAVSTQMAMWRLRTLDDALESRSAVISPIRPVHKLPAMRVGHRADAVLTVSNLGLGAMTVAHVAASGNGFTVVKNNCHTIRGQGSCSVTVRFSPHHPGLYAATIRVLADTPSGGTATRLQGRATRR